MLPPHLALDSIAERYMAAAQTSSPEQAARLRARMIEAALRFAGRLARRWFCRSYRDCVHCHVRRIHSRMTWTGIRVLADVHEAGWGSTVALIGVQPSWPAR